MFSPDRRINCIWKSTPIGHIVIHAVITRIVLCLMSVHDGEWPSDLVVICVTQFKWGSPRKLLLTESQIYMIFIGPASKIPHVKEVISCRVSFYILKVQTAGTIRKTCFSQEEEFSLVQLEFNCLSQLLKQLLWATWVLCHLSPISAVIVIMSIVRMSYCCIAAGWWAVCQIRWSGQQAVLCCWTEWIGLSWWGW